MKTKLVLSLAAALLSAPAVFAQTHVQSSTGASVSSGTGMTVTPGVTTTVTTSPVTVMGAAPSATIYGGVTAQAGASTEVVNGNTKTTTTRYWFNVPAGIEHDADFQRWQRLR